MNKEDLGIVSTLKPVKCSYSVVCTVVVYVWYVAKIFLFFRFQEDARLVAQGREVRDM